MGEQISFPGWETVRLIGRGSTGEVYEIRRNTAAGPERAALRVIPVSMGADGARPGGDDNSEGGTIALRSRLRYILAQCAQMQALGKCGNIATWAEADYVRQENGSGWNVLVKMELLTPLAEAIPAEPDEKTVVKLGKDLCAALQACEKQGIVHRDVQPGNIFVSASGAYKLGDFGIGKTGAELPAEFRTPEAEGNQVHVYSLGRILYWLLNGQRIGSGEALPEPANGSQELRKIVMKACAPDPKDRYANASELRRALDALRTPAAPVVIPGGAVNVSDPVTTASETGPAGISSGSGRTGNGRFLELAPKIVLAIAAVVILGALAALAAVTLGCDHQWVDADCTAPRQCSLCGETEGEPRGHVWMDATCTNPMQCLICGVTDGSALVHNWQSADCTNPRGCTLCGITEGSALGHAWVDATLDAPKTCLTCGTTEGEPLRVEPVYLNELDFCDKYGKLWTRSESYLDVYTNTDFNDMNTPGHITGPVYDHMGNRYTYGLHVDLAGPASRYYVSYDLDGKYTTFTGVCSMAEERKGTNATKYFEIYCDGVLVFTSRVMTDGAAPQSFAIDVTGVETLRIQYPATKGENSIATIFDGKLR